MAHRDTGPDWVFIGGMTFAISSVVAFAATAFYFFVMRPL